MKQASSDGFMGYENFYRIISMMGEAADMMDEAADGSGALSLGAGVVLHNSEEAADLINKAA